MGSIPLYKCTTTCLLITKQQEGIAYNYTQQMKPRTNVYLIQFHLYKVQYLAKLVNAVTSQQSSPLAEGLGKPVTERA